MKLTVLIPALNEEDNIEETIRETTSIIKEIREIESYNIIVVDDHSADSTFKTVADLKEENVVCLRLSRRGGSHTALRTGLSQVSSDAALCISADGQDDLSCLKEMILKWKCGAKIVWALRRKRTNEPFTYKILAKLFYIILGRITDNKVSGIDQSRADFFLLDKLVINAVNRCGENITSLFGLLIWLGFEQDYVEYERRVRRHGKSKWGITGSFRMVKMWIIAFSGVPLKIMLPFGFIVSVSGLFFAVRIIYNVFFGPSVPVGWSSIMVAILVIGGIQMMMLGLLGEYLWRNLEESRRRPVFFIEKRSDGKKIK